MAREHVLNMRLYPRYHACIQRIYVHSMFDHQILHTNLIEQRLQITTFDDEEHGHVLEEDDNIKLPMGAVNATDW